MKAYEAGRLVAAVVQAVDDTGQSIGAVVERFRLGAAGMLYIIGHDGRQVMVRRNSPDEVEWVLLNGDPSGPGGVAYLAEGDGYASLDGAGARLARGIAECLR